MRESAQSRAARNRKGLLDCIHYLTDLANLLGMPQVARRLADAGDELLKVNAAKKISRRKKNH